jgi:hypothetical protein
VLDLERVKEIADWACVDAGCDTEPAARVTARRAPLRALVMRGRIHRSPEIEQATVTDTNVATSGKATFVSARVCVARRTWRPSGR